MMFRWPQTEISHKSASCSFLHTLGADAFARNKLLCHCNGDVFAQILGVVYHCYTSKYTLNFVVHNGEVRDAWHTVVKIVVQDSLS